jgi:hypothetical protein
MGVGALPAFQLPIWTARKIVKFTYKIQGHIRGSETVF